MNRLTPRTIESRTASLEASSRRCLLQVRQCGSAAVSNDDASPSLAGNAAHGKRVGSLPSRLCRHSHISMEKEWTLTCTSK